MVAFARFVMRDNGLAIHINPEQVTQIRQTIEGDPAIYIAGRDTPMTVEGTMEGALRKLEAASVGLKIVEEDVPAPFEEPEATPPAPEPPIMEIAAAPELPPAEVAAAPEPKAKAGKAKGPRKSAVSKAPAKAKVADAKPSRPAPEPEAPYPAASWFRGNI
ncbi:MAG: hypothetical protein ACREEB_04370 [Caulobacteraceae bacterium]